MSYNRTLRKQLRFSKHLHIYTAFSEFGSCPFFLFVTPSSKQEWYPNSSPSFNLVEHLSPSYLPYL